MSGPGDDPDDPAQAETIDASSVAATPSGTTSPSARGFVPVGPGTVLGRYEILDELGAGGMATVYRARDPQLRREVAIKVMFPHLAKKPEIARRFQREARAAAGLEHPNILRVYDVGGGRTADTLPDEPPHIVMELVRGASLRDISERHGPLLAEIVACIGAVLCDALAVAHGAGVVHRDVKPGNVLVAEDGRLLLADFGVARIEDDDSLVTRTGALLGTPSFMSPEQASGDPVDARSDVYSVGATLYQLATGSVPFSGPTAVIVAAIARGEYTAPARRRPQIGAELGRAIEKLMARDPEARPATAAAAAELLRGVARDGGLGEPRDELAAFFRDPVGYERARTPEVVAHALARAKDAIAARSLPRAIALLDRVLAIEPDHAEARALSERIAPRPRRALFAALAGAALLAGGGGIYLATRDTPAPVATILPDAAPDAEPDAEPVPVPVPVPVPDPEPDAAPAPSVDDPKPRPKPRTTPVDAAPPDADAEPEPVPVPVPVPDPAPPPPAAPATLTILLDAWCDLSIDATPLGRADRKKRYPVDPGTHTITCSQGTGMSSWSETVTVAAGEHRTLRGTLLGTVRVTVAVSSGDRVRVGGATYANGDRIDLKPGRVRVEVLRGAEPVTSGWVSLPRIAACTLKDRPDLDCYP